MCSFKYSCHSYSERRKRNVDFLYIQCHSFLPLSQNNVRFRHLLGKKGGYRQVQLVDKAVEQSLITFELEDSIQLLLNRFL